MLDWPMSACASMLPMAAYPPATRASKPSLSMMRADSASYAPGISTRRLPAMIVLSFFLALMSSLQRSKPAVDRGLQPRLVGGRALLPARDLVGVLEGQPDVVEAFEQAHAVGGRDIEADIGAAGAGDALGSKIDRERRRAVDRYDAVRKRRRVARFEHDREQSVLQAVLAINVGKAPRDDDADVVRQHSPHRRFARGPGAEIVAGHENAGVAELRLVEHEVGILAAVITPARAHELLRLVVALEAAHRLHRRDLVGVDVVLDERDGDAGMGREWLHQGCPDMSCRTSAMRPGTAVAAAVAGLTRCVRTLGPWRCSKLRLVVETQRSPGSPRSPLPPAHMEQPDSPHKNPASRNTRSSPAFSAARFTVVDPGTTIAMTPAATCRPRTTSAAALRSGKRLLVHEPMKTRSTGTPASAMPGCNPI